MLLLQNLEQSMALPQTTELTLDLERILLFHQPLKHRAAALIHLGQAQLVTNIIDQCPDVVLSLCIASAQGFLTKKATALAGLLEDAGTVTVTYSSIYHPNFVTCSFSYRALAHIPRHNPIIV